MSIQQREAQIEAGKLQGQAIGSLPRAQQAAEGALRLIEEIRTHPGRNMWSTGPLGRFTPAPGSRGYDFAQLVNQAGSGAFLSAFETLRGGGQISNVEGEKATQAIARMQRAQSPEGFEQALNDYRQVIQTGWQNAQRIARGEMQPYPTDVPGMGGPQAGGGQTGGAPRTAAQPPPGFRRAPDGRYISERPGPNGKYQIWTPD
jgi:hypothetical protein